MQTVYVDIYFLINFTVDFLALYFAALLSKIPTTVIRLSVGATFGAVTALANLFIERTWLGYAVLVLGFIAMIIASTKKVSLYRRFKLAFCFSIAEMLLGGFVYLLYDLFERYLEKGIQNVAGGGDRELLIFAVLVLLSIGLFKCLVALFSFSSSNRTVEVDLRMNGRRVVADALVDTGNLARDPLDMRAVALVGKAIAGQLLGEESASLKSPETLEANVKKRIRLIPVAFGKHRRLLMGFRPDAVYVKTNKGREEIDIVVAIDEDGGRYGDAEILMPAVAIGDIR